MQLIKQFTRDCKILLHVDKYNNDNEAPSNNAGPADNTLVLPPTDIDHIHGEQLNNTIIQSQLETTTYVLPETFIGTHT